MSQDNCTSGAGGILARPRLINLIEEPTLVPITLIAAPAGYGKSTLATQWAKHTSCDIAWISLDPDYNDPDRFLDQLSSDLSLADGNHHAISAADILARLKARTDVRRLMIVLDDLHHIESDEVYGLLNRFLAARIPNVHWMILTRTMPVPWHLPGYGQTVRSGRSGRINSGLPPPKHRSSRKPSPRMI